MIQPQEMYLPYPDLHQDHIATYEAGMRTARASMKKDHWYVPSVFVYDVAAYTLELRPYWVEVLTRSRTFQVIPTRRRGKPWTVTSPKPPRLRLRPTAPR